MERNELYSVFFKVSQLHILIVGGGNVAEEKLTFLLKPSPNTQLEMVSPMFREAPIRLVKKFNITMHKAVYDATYLEGKINNIT